VKFWKYQGLGNDFILLEDWDDSSPKDEKFVTRLCDRHFGIGADGILYLQQSDKADCRMQIMNSDGSEAEMCGNGIRCLAKHYYDYKEKKERITVETLAGIMTLDLKIESGEANEVTVNMGPPRLKCKEIPMDCRDLPTDEKGRFIESNILVDGRVINGTAVSMGNPHFITFEPFKDEEIDKLGPRMERHGLFPRRTNVEFASFDDDGLKARVFERGVGWTLACGTGACATVVAAVLTGRLPYDVENRIRLTGGELWVRLPKDLSAAYMRGPAYRVFKGEIEDW
jgi:diaminopimelate epimerase